MREYRVEKIDENQELTKFLNCSAKEGWKTQSIQLVNTGYFYKDFPKTIILQYKDD